MNVLVLNLTRLGDLLQCQPAISGLAAAGHRVGLLCLDNFAPAAALMRDLEAVFPLPGGRLLARLDADWRMALGEHRRLLDAIRADFPPDRVINLTPSQPARLLAMGLAPAGRAEGFALDDHGFNADTSLWAAFLQLAASSRGASPFNVVDLFRRIAGCEGAPVDTGLCGPSDEERKAARERLLSLLPEPPARGFVALQLGASENRRRWPVAHFARVAQGLRRAGFAPVLVGTREEASLGERLKAAVDGPVADLMGATGLRELAAVLANCRLLVTNDTGTMHLAAGLGVPCLALFLATAQPWDTGPGLPGSLCLEPDLPCHPCGFGETCPNALACRQSIAPKGVLELALELLAGAPPRKPANCSARLWRTVRAADGMLDLESLSGHEGEDRTRLIRLQRLAYRPYLDGASLDGISLPPARLGAATAMELGGALSEAAQLLTLLSRQGELLARDPLPTMKTKFLATWQRVRGCLEGRTRLGLLAALWTFEAERPGLDLAGILALAARFAGLIDVLRRSISAGTGIA